jgi:hypothetical protein
MISSEEICKTKPSRVMALLRRGKKFSGASPATAAAVGCVVVAAVGAGGALGVEGLVHPMTAPMDRIKMMNASTLKMRRAPFQFIIW